MIEYSSCRPGIQEGFFGIVEKLSQFVDNVLRSRTLIRRIDAHQALDGYCQSNQQPEQEITHVFKRSYYTQKENIQLETEPSHHLVGRRRSTIIENNREP